MSVNDSYTPPTTESSKPLDVSSAPPTAAANVPDLMKIGAMPINTQMEVETDILDPVVFSETFCRYRLQNKGILHSNSKLTFGLDVSSGSNAKTILPPNIGIHSIIDRAVLKIGTKTICETDGFNHFMNFRSSFVNPQHNKQRESVTSSRLMCRKWDYDLGEAGHVSASGRVDSINLASNYTLDTGFEISSLNTSLSASYNYDVHQYTLLNAVASRASGTGTSDFQITINDLFPFLKMNQLPLYMMKEEIDIELFFTAEKKRAVTIGTALAADVYACKLVRSDCRLIADYIYYPQEIMTAYQNANSNMSFTYVDYRLVKHTVDATGGAAQKIILNVGGAPFIFEAMIMHISDDITLTSLDIDPSEYSKEINDLGLEVIGCDIEKQSARDNVNFSDYDVLCVCELFEHMRLDLIGTFEDIYNKMKSGSYLYLTTPNFFYLPNILGILKAKRSGPGIIKQWKKIKDFGHMGHVREYTPIELKEFLEYFGFETIDILPRNTKKYYVGKNPAKFLIKFISQIFSIFSNDFVILVKKN